MNPSLERSLWCRWFHRLRMPRHAEAPVVSRDPSGSGQALVLSAGPSRSCCDACADVRYESRAARRWRES